MASRNGSIPRTGVKPGSAQSQKAQYSAPQSAAPSEAGTPFNSQPGTPGVRSLSPRTTRAQSLDLSSFDTERDKLFEEFDPNFGQDISIIRKYLRDTAVESSFRTLCNLLLSRADIPTNPYPGFVRRIRQLAESFHMQTNNKTELEIQKLFDFPYKNSEISYMTFAESHQHIWGLPNIVRCVDPFIAQDYIHLVEDLTPRISTLQAEDGFSNQVTATLVGPAVFHGSFYDVPLTVQVRIDYLITGLNQEKAIDLFISSVLADINYMLQFTSHTVLGVNLPVRQKGKEDIWYYDFWSVDMVQSDEGVLWNKLHDVVYENKLISAEIIMRTDPYTDVYRRGQKQYGLSYIQTNNLDDHNEVLCSFTELPMMTLFEGYFFKRVNAESYMGMYLPRKELSGQKGPDKALDNPEPNKKYPGKNRDFGAKYREKLGFKKAGKTERVEIDGFRFHDEENPNSPYSWNVTSPVRSLWQRKIASLHPQLEIFEAAHLILLLSLMDKESTDDAIFIELHHLFHSTAARMVRLLDRNKVIRELIINYEAEEVSSLVNKTFHEYRRELRELLNSHMHERSIDTTTMAQRIDERLESILTKEDGSIGESVPLNTDSVIELRFVNLYCSMLFNQFIEDALAECPLINQFISVMKSTFPEYTQKPETQEKTHQPDRMGGSTVGLHKSEVKYGLEYQPLMIQDRQVINVEMCIERDLAPKNIVIESVLIKYMIDVHLDEVWSEFLADLLSGALLPPNPYPKLVTHLRQATLKMHLLFESNRSCVKRMQHATPKLADPQNFIYEIPGCDGHGHISAMCILDTAAFFVMSQLTKKLTNTNFVQKKGLFKIAMTMAISGQSPMYGRMDPYLRMLELHEHCYIKGPNGCYGEAIQIYAKIVVSHLYDMLRKGEYIFHGFYLGNEEERWTADDIIGRKRAFTAEFERIVAKKEALVLKFYMVVDWQYVPVVKKHLFHYVNSDETEWLRFFNWNPVHLYQNLFFETEKASFHFQQGATPDNQTPFSGPNLRIAFNLLDQRVMKEVKDFNWIKVHRLLLTKTLMNQGTTHIAETWRMLHSIAAQLEYLNTLNMSIQELILYAMEEKEKRDKNPTKNIPHEQKIMLGGLNTKTFGLMMEAYRSKIDKVLKTMATMAPKLLPEMVDAKFKQCCERDGVTDEQFVKITVKSVQTMEQVRQMLLGLQETLAYEVHLISPEAQAAIISIEAEQNNRPVTYEWSRVEQPESYHYEPKIRISASEDRIGEWTHR